MYNRGDSQLGALLFLTLLSSGNGFNILEISIVVFATSSERRVDTQTHRITVWRVISCIYSTFSHNRIQKKKHCWNAESLRETLPFPSELTSSQLLLSLLTEFLLNIHFNTHLIFTNISTKEYRVQNLRSEPTHIITASIIYWLSYVSPTTLPDFSAMLRATEYTDDIRLLR